MPVVGVIQARMGSTRLPGKVTMPIGDRPLILWTVEAMEAVTGLDELVVATTTDPVDDPLVELLAGRVRTHRGPIDDVLTRIWEAVSDRRPDHVVRETADNPFVDPSVVGAQLAWCRDGGLDYVGIAGWPLGIAAEVARGDALETAYLSATDPAEREHVMPYLYRTDGRFRVGSMPPPVPPPPGRYTVDTARDLDFVRAVADRLGPVRQPTIEDLRRIVAAEPELLTRNADVTQKGWQEAAAG